jgi:hypothetical protein
MKPFIRTKKIKGHEYLYEVTPYLDKVTGKWKQKTKYLGRNIDGAPVKKTRIPKMGQVYELGQYIPSYWAIREYKIFEALLSCFEPEEVSLLLVMAVNRLVLPCSPRQVNSWLSSTWLSHMIPGVHADPGSIFQLLHTISNRSVIGLFSRMISLINNFSDKRVIMSGRVTDYSQFKGSRGEGYLYKDLLEGDFGIRMIYDHDMRVLIGCEISDIKRNFIEESLNIMNSGRIPGGVLLPNWDYFSPVLIQNLISIGYPFIIRPDSMYEPVLNIITNWDERTSPGIECMHRGEPCLLKECMVQVGYTSVRGYILHHLKKEQTIRHVFEKNLQNIQDMIIQGENDADSLDGLIHEVAGLEQDFFLPTILNGSLKRNQKMITREIRRLSRSIILYQGNYSWDECFFLSDTQWRFERDLFSLYRNFKRDLFGHQTERIKTGMLFVCFLSIMIKTFILKRLELAHLEEISSSDALLAELVPIHVITSPNPQVVPIKFSRRQKTILSYFGGIPGMK